MTTLQYRAHAKINWGLDVLGPRADGYHEVRTVLQSVALHDVIEVLPSASGIDLTCTDPTLSTGPDNLVVKAAEALRAATGCEKGAKIHLVKRIPAQAGLGGGSSDAAVTLIALGRLWRIGWEPAAFMEIAARLGSDVPFFLLGGTALGIGRGEEVYPLPDAPPMQAVILKPRAGTSTAKAYALLDATLTRSHPTNTIWNIVQGVVNGRLDERLLFNRFEEVTEQAEGDGPEARRALLDAGACRIVLAGSGSAWVGLFHSRSQAQEAYRKMTHRGYTAALTQTLPRKDYWDRMLPRTEKESLS